jgi:hypothetical protein
LLFLPTHTPETVPNLLIGFHLYLDDGDDCNSSSAVAEPEAGEDVPKKRGPEVEDPKAPAS